MSKEAAEILRTAREKKGWTQEEMAGKLNNGKGITYRQYNKYEAGIFPKFKRDVVEEIEGLLGIKISELIYEQDVPREGKGTLDTKDLLQVMVGLMKTQNTILERQEKDLVEKVNQMNTNLNSVLGRSESLQYELISGREAVLQSLARLEKKPEDSLLIKADKRKRSLAESKAGHHRKAGANR